MLKAVTIRLPEELVDELDKAVEQTGFDRSALTRACMRSFLHHLKKTGKLTVPVDWDEIVKR